MLSKEEYINYYKDRGKTVDQIGKSNNPLNERHLLTKYNKYVAKEEKKNNSYVVDEKWLETKQLVKDRDKGVCQLLNKLPFQIKQTLIENSNGFYKILDPAHRISRGSSVSKKYEVSNVWTLNRYSHSLLDQYKHPIYGHNIKKKEHDLWWQIIIGEIKYEEKLWQEKV